VNSESEEHVEDNNMLNDDDMKYCVAEIWGWLEVGWKEAMEICKENQIIGPNLLRQRKIVQWIDDCFEAKDENTNNCQHSKLLKIRELSSLKFKNFSKYHLDLSFEENWFLITNHVTQNSLKKKLISHRTN
jgi:hypothetical protein